MFWFCKLLIAVLIDYNIVLSWYSTRIDALQKDGADVLQARSELCRFLKEPQSDKSVLKKKSSEEIQADKYLSDVKFPEKEFTPLSSLIERKEVLQINHISYITLITINVLTTVIFSKNHLAIRKVSLPSSCP